MFQIIIYSILSASKIIIIAISFAMIYRVVRFFYFAHGVVFTAGVYLAFLFNIWLVWPFWISVLIGIILSGIMGCVIEIMIYLPLRKKGANQLIQLLSSLGIYIILQNIISIIFGDETKSIRTGIVQEGINILSARITPIQIVTICVSIVLVVVLYVFLKKTKIGSAMRAVASDPVLANVSGINSNRVILWAFAIGSALTGLAGVLIALDVDMTPTMGMNALMIGVVAMIIGGINSIPGIALGALLLATAQHLGAWYIGSQWQDAIAFVILILFLLFKPEGFFGKKNKSVTV